MNLSSIFVNKEMNEIKENTKVISTNKRVTYFKSNGTILGVTAELNIVNEHGMKYCNPDASLGWETADVLRSMYTINRVNNS